MLLTCAEYLAQKTDFDFHITLNTILSSKQRKNTQRESQHKVKKLENLGKRDTSISGTRNTTAIVARQVGGDGATFSVVNDEIDFRPEPQN